MHVKRIEVEGGFLDGLDLNLSPGLNVIIGPRGTGKTSIIELLRFALGVGRLAPTTRDVFDQRAILGSGRVTVTVEDSGEISRFVRSAADANRVEPVSDLAPLILAQNEIEEVGRDPYGRLNLIDGSRSERNMARRHEAAMRARVKALTVAISAGNAEIATVRDELAQEAEIPAKLQEALAAQAQFAASLAAHDDEQRDLAAIDASLTAVRLRAATLDRALTALRSWSQHVDGALFQVPALDSALLDDTDDPLAELRPLVQDAEERVREAVSTLARAVALAELRVADSRRTQEEFEAQARDLRRALETVQEGAGTASRAVAELRSRLAELESLRAVVDQKQVQVLSLQSQRGAALAELDSLREARFKSRAAIAQHLNQLLAPYIEVEITSAGLFDGYIQVLVNLLQGSNLRYNTLAPQIAAAVPPAELVRLAEAGDAATLATIVGIERDRAARILGYLSDRGLEDILSVEIEDFVEFLLMDGTEYKPTDHLSTGQRCTVVLPILLGYAGRPLVVDQPEDHLDNNFVADTLIRAIRKRKHDTQLIISSHNANIPVLGDADRVISLGSNGIRGFVRASGALDDPVIVEAITSVMEGGREAFKKRAAFYEDHLGVF
jgi:energy-coupling factor transporter ATP-binding protein EcfA2